MSFYVSDVTTTTARSLSASTAVNGTPIASNDPSSPSQDQTTLIVAREDPVDTNAMSDQELVQLVERLRTPVGPPGKKKTAPVVVKDRLYHLRRYKECFVARDFVQTVMALGYCHTRREAVDIGRTLCRRGQMHHGSIFRRLQRCCTAGGMGTTRYTITGRDSLLPQMLACMVARHVL